MGEETAKHLEDQTHSYSGLSRRQFLRKSGQLSVSLGSLLLGVSCGTTQPSVSPAPSLGVTPFPSPQPSPAPGVTQSPTITVKGVDLAVAKAESPQVNTRAAVDALGGIGRFVKRGDVVVVKPNICASRKPEYAATTNPEVVETLVRMCLEAGAKTVKVFDGPFSGVVTAYDESGIAAAVKRAGGQMDKMSLLKYKQMAIPDGKALKKVEIYDDMLNSDVVINVPIAKDHELARLTLGMKNMMGVIRDRPSLHGQVGQKVADLATLVRAHLTVVDATRILIARGPLGGNLSDVRQTKTVIASADIVAADSFATTLFGMTGNDVAYVRRAFEMGLGEMDLKKLSIREISA